MQYNKYTDIPAEFRWALEEAIRVKQELTQKHLRTTIQRWSIETRSGKRGAVIVDQLATQNKLKKRLSKFGVVVRSSLVPSANVNIQSVVCIDEQFHVTSNYVGFEKTVMQSKYHLDILHTERIITKHAILRWMVRNNSKDVDAALFTLGKAIADLDTQIGKATIIEAIKPHGYTERQVICDDGGIAILVIDNPEEERYKYMKWALVTYISEDMIMDWNIEAAESEFPNVKKMTYQDFISSNYFSSELIGKRG